MTDPTEDSLASEIKEVLVKRRHWSRMFTRPVRLAIDAFFALVLLFGILIGGLMWRLNYGPISMEPALPAIQDMLTRVAPGMNFTAKKSMLLPGSNRWRAFEVHLYAVAISNPENEEIGGFEEMTLGFSWRNFFRLTLVPAIIEIRKPTVHVTRFPDGHIGFALVSKEKKKEPKEMPELARMISRTLPALREVQVYDASVYYDDQKENISFEAQNGLFYFKRESQVISGTLALDVKAKNFEQKLRGTIEYDPDKEETHFTLGVKDLPPDQLSAFIPQIPKELEWKMPIDMMVSAVVDKAYMPAGVEIQLTGKKGTFTYPPYYPQGIDISDLLIRARYNPIDRSVLVEQIYAHLKDAALRAQASLKRAEDPTQPAQIEVVGLLENFPVDGLKNYWPQGLAKDARSWIVEHLYDGIVDRAGIVMNGELDNENKFTINELGGKVAFHGMTVDYLPPMKSVKNVTAEAQYDLTHFGITVKSGEIYDTKVQGADIDISGFDQPRQIIALDIKTKGPAKDVIDIISAKPLEYPQKLGFRADQFSGEADTVVSLRFPLLHDLHLNQVEMATKADLKNLTVRNAVKDLTVSGENMKIAVDTEKLELSGDGKLADASAVLSWQEFFKDDAPLTTSIDIKGAITPAVLKSLRLPSDNYFTGSAQADVKIIKDKNKKSTITVSSDLQKAAIKLSELKVEKVAGSAGKLDLVVTSFDKGSTTISGLNASWKDFALKNGDVQLSAAGDLQSANLKGMSVGRTQTDITVTPISNGIKAVLRGDTIDLSGYWTAPKDPNKKETTDKRRYDVDVTARRLYLDPEIPFQNLKASLSVQNKVLLRASISGTLDQNGSLRIQQSDLKNGGRRLALRGANAGRVLQALDITDSVQGGTLTFDGVSTKETPDVIGGGMELTNFSIVKAPAMARLINAFSVRGLIDLFNTKGLAFSKMSGQVILENPQTIRLKDGRMAGASLGMTFKGRVYRDSDTVNLSGTIVPIEGINGMVGKIPLIGTILGGLKGEGLLAATYKIKGPTSDPQVSVNPLSVLAPGILRSIFFQSSDD